MTDILDHLRLCSSHGCHYGDDSCPAHDLLCAPERKVLIELVLARRVVDALRRQVWLWDSGYLRRESGTEAERRIAEADEMARSALAAYDEAER